MKYGGNLAFRDFLNDYNVPTNTPIELKYTLVASDYYRQYVYKE
jgi:hypothetical protein